MTPTDGVDPLRTIDDAQNTGAAPSMPTQDISHGDAATQLRDCKIVTEITADAPTVPGYQILDVLGRGGMGVVYKALHLTLKRVVALKMILSGGHAGPGELACFRTEAQAVARLQHPNIVQPRSRSERQ